MNDKLYNIIVRFFLISIVISFFYSCHINHTQNVTPPTIEDIENTYFILDFEKNSCNMSDVENVFFTTFPHDDPTQGNVVYDRRKWVNENMIRLEKEDGLYLYIKDRNDDIKYDSVRITSKAYYNLNEFTPKILFVFKGKLPSAQGVWPAWWLNGSKQDQWIYKDLGYIDTDMGLDRHSGKGNYYDMQSAVNPTDWPTAGEIDIIETINGDDVIHNTLHTCPQMCDSEWRGDRQIVNCGNAKPGLDPNSGCSGAPYDAVNAEGTFACLWNRNTIQFYYWKPGVDVRANGGPLSKNPNPDLWRIENLKNEVQLLETEIDCNSDAYGEWQCNNCKSSSSCVFKNMKMIFNITLCGKWAGAEFDDTAYSLANCQKYIFGEAKHAIHNQFLKIEYISVRKL